MSANIGKIGRLPEAIRERLNQRLAEGEEGAPLVNWLNGLPEVRAMVAAQFEGVPISETNLSRWRTGGYQRWLMQQERQTAVWESTEDAWQLETQTKARPNSVELNRQFTVLFTADFVVSARAQLAEVTEPAARCALIQGYLKTLKGLRREDYMAERLKLEQDRREAEREAEERDEDRRQERESIARQFVDNPGGLFSSPDNFAAGPAGSGQQGPTGAVEDGSLDGEG